MEIAVISDTHMPRGGRRLPARAVELMKAADVIVHSGDFMRLEIVRQIESYGRLVAVHGNVDESAIQRMLPTAATVELPDGVRVGVIHDAGPSRGRLERMRRSFPATTAVIFGHSHIPLHETGEDGFQIFNPGSPTERRRAPRHTMGWATVIGGAISFELIALD